MNTVSLTPARILSVIKSKESSSIHFHFSPRRVHWSRHSFAFFVAAVAARHISSATVAKSEWDKRDGVKGARRMRSPSLPACVVDFLFSLIFFEKASRSGHSGVPYTRRGH